jgi:hemerythrin superfamily protein
MSVPSSFGTAYRFFADRRALFDDALRAAVRRMFSVGILGAFFFSAALLGVVFFAVGVFLPTVFFAAFLAAACLVATLLAAAFFAAVFRAAAFAAAPFVPALFLAAFFAVAMTGTYCVRAVTKAVRPPPAGVGPRPMTQTSKIDAVDFLLDQHAQIRMLFEAVATTAGDQRREAFESLVRLLAVHETAEEIVVYPSIRLAGEEGQRTADARLAEEDEAKKLLVDLEKLDIDSANFEQLFLRIRAAVEAHASAEEDTVFPVLEQLNDPEQLQRMASALEVAQRMAPTHPHKTAPESATGNLLVGPFVGMVDRVRDALRGIGR